MDLVMKAKAPKLEPVITIRIKPVVKRTLPLLFFLLCSAALAESGAYRVEVIVFRNLAVTTEAAEVETLRSFSTYPALEIPILPAPPNLMNTTEIADTATKQPGDTRGTSEPGEETAEPRRFDLPDDLRVIMEKSPAVDDAWRRLRGSADYRPLLFAAWEQNRIDYYPPLRIHDQQLLETQLRPPTQFMLADLTAPDPLAAYRSTFYQLDGSLQLRRSRFLHLYLDLEFREKQPATDSSEPGQYHVHSIRQNRQVRTGQMQYFDTPQFGVLVLVTAIQPG